MKETRSRYAVNGMSPRWTEAETDLLISLWEDDLSASEIAAKMGRTRNEVLGKLWRERKAAA